MGNLPFETLKREIWTKKDCETSDKFGCKPKDRPAESLFNYGIVNIDKPKGPTSHQVSAYVQKILKIKKSGHSGTLDPKVTGVLPTALGKSTRAVQVLLIAGKEYICLMHIHKEVPKDTIREKMGEFVGKIRQMPPIKSAVKRQWRYRNVYYIDILDIKEKDVLFKVGCQAGTYIRKLCHDMGTAMGTGAHMAELRRTKAGPFMEDTLVSLQDLTDAVYYFKEEGNDKLLRHVIKPIEFAVQHLAKVWVMDTAVENICQGADLAVPGICKVHENIEKNHNIAIMTLKGELIALGEARMGSSEMLKKTKGIAVKTRKVFLPIGTYPKIQRDTSKTKSIKDNNDNNKK